MEELREILERYLNKDLILLVLSSPRKDCPDTKVRLRPVSLKGGLCFQAEIFRGAQVFHENLKGEEAVRRCLDWMTDSFCQLQLSSRGGNVSALVSRKGKLTLKEKRAEAGKTGSEEYAPAQHNRKKEYLIPEGRPVPFLVDLGVMTAEGKVISAHYDKFRQINRFLEFIRDALPELPGDREIKIVDFGCGKSYLTFAIYYYLHECLGLDADITGLDLKADVIEHCEQLSRKYGYEKLHFLVGDIAGYEGDGRIDMMVSLHACDTATDYALYRAVKLGAKVILSVPCCQHELNSQIENEMLEPILGYGLLKERFSALATDALRAKLLETQGYEVQVPEFIDMENTPKNVLIRAVRRKTEDRAALKRAAEEYECCAGALHADLTLGRLFAADSSGMVYNETDGTGGRKA